MLRTDYVTRAAPILGSLMFWGCVGTIDGGDGADGDGGGTAGASAGGAAGTGVATGTGEGTGTDTGVTTDTGVATGTGTQTGTGTGTGPVDCGAWPSGQQGLAVGNVLPESLAWSGYGLSSNTLGTVNASDFYDCDGSKGIDAVLFTTAQLN